MPAPSQRPCPGWSPPSPDGPKQHHLVEVVTRDLKPLRNLRHSDSLLTRWRAEVHQHTKAKVGEAGELHCGAPGCVPEHTAQHSQAEGPQLQRMPSSGKGEIRRPRSAMLSIMGCNCCAVSGLRRVANRRQRSNTFGRGTHLESLPLRNAFRSSLCRLCINRLS